MSNFWESKYFIAGLFFLMLFSVASLILGFSWLEYPVSFLFNIPLGNLIVPLGLVSGASLAVRLSKKASFKYRFAQLLAIMALLWLPVSIYLAGNVEINFSGNSNDIWFKYTALISLSILVLLVWSLFLALYRTLFKKYADIK